MHKSTVDTCEEIRNCIDSAIRCIVTAKGPSRDNDMLRAEAYLNKAKNLVMKLERP